MRGVKIPTNGQYQGFFLRLNVFIVLSLLLVVIVLLIVYLCCKLKLDMQAGVKNSLVV